MKPSKPKPETVEAVRKVEVAAAEMELAMKEYHAGVRLERPDNAFTVLEFATHHKMTIPAAAGILNRLVDKGEWEVVSAYGVTADARTRPLRYFRKKIMGVAKDAGNHENPDRVGRHVRRPR
jgi:hypothetical protein